MPQPGFFIPRSSRGRGRSLPSTADGIPPLTSYFAAQTSLDIHLSSLHTNEVVGRPCPLQSVIQNRLLTSTFMRAGRSEHASILPRSQGVAGNAAALTEGSISCSGSPGSAKTQRKS
jgi:hypothetical protein